MTAPVGLVLPVVAGRSDWRLATDVERRFAAELDLPPPSWARRASRARRPTSILSAICMTTGRKDGDLAR